MACDVCELSLLVDNSTGAAEVTYHSSWAGLVLDRMVVEIACSQ